MVLMLKSGYPSLCLVEFLVLHCAVAMETQAKPGSCGGALCGSKVHPASIFLILICGILVTIQANRLKNKVI